MCLVVCVCVFISSPDKSAETKLVLDNNLVCLLAGSEGFRGDSVHVREISVIVVQVSMIWWHERKALAAIV